MKHLPAGRKSSNAPMDARMCLKTLQLSKESRQRQPPLQKVKSLQTKGVEVLRCRLSKGWKEGGKMKVYPGMLMKTKDRFSTVYAEPCMLNKNQALIPVKRECHRKKAG
jgi:hypothetical protein